MCARVVSIASPPPSRCTASDFASAAVMPCATRSSMRASRNAVSSSSASERMRAAVRSRSRKSRCTPARTRCSDIAVSYPWADCAARMVVSASVYSVSLFVSAREMRTSSARQPVVARTASLLRDSPLGNEYVSLLEPVQGLHERGVLHREAAARAIFEPLRDLECVHRTPRESLQHEHVESSFEKRHAQGDKG